MSPASSCTMSPGTTSVAGDRVAVSIRDDGEGIAPDAQQKLFDSGYTTKRAGGGSGLGLAIAQRIVSDHGGSISVDSAPGQGATFTVMLPVAGPR